MKNLLDTRSSRSDLTRRECAAILGSIIGGLMQLSNATTIRNAVRWWAETDAAWLPLEQLKDVANAAVRACNGDN